MPRPNPSCPQDNTRSKNNQKNHEDSKTCETEFNFDNELKCNFKEETLTLVKSFLGPSLEGTVLKTLEFGKSLIQRSDDVQKESEELEKSPTKEITTCEVPRQQSGELSLENLIEHDINKDTLKHILHSFNSEGKKNLKLLYDIKNSNPKASSSIKQNVSKIRSLDSDLKQSPPSPENIKKQLEALIQITKNEPPKQSWSVIPKASKIPVEMTVMPSLCMYKKEAEMNYSSSCDINSQSKDNDCECSGSKSTPLTKKRYRSKICQAPEFITNALGPTIDVSIIDNLKMMRNFFKNDSGKGEECEPKLQQDIRFRGSEMEMTCRLEELQKKIEELEEKEKCLKRHIEEKERQMQCKRKEFEEEERRMCEQRACFEALGVEKRKSSGKCLMDCSLEAKYEKIQEKITLEEEKLSRLKCQFDQYKSDIAEAKMRKEALKRNKCVLDAWDVFASRICHTRLPSFSLAHKLERKQFQTANTANLHCCLPPIQTKSSKQFGCKNRSENKSQCDVCGNGDGGTPGSQTTLQCKLKMGEIQFPIQRDIVCGLHQMLKSCNCSKPGARIYRTYSSEEELGRKTRGTCKNRNRNMGVESSMDMATRNACGDKHPCRSKSDTSLKQNKCSKITKVMWAVARINIFQNNFRTYEILEASSTPPCKIPNKTEGIFVVKSKKKSCPSSPRKHCPPNPSRY